MDETPVAPAEAPSAPPAPLAPQAEPEPVAAPPEPAEGGEPGPEPEPSYSFKSLEELAEHEEVSGLIRQREEAALEKGRSETHSRMQPFLERQTKFYEDTATKVDGLFNAIKRAQRDGTLDADGLNNILEDHGDAINALRGVDAERGRWAGITQLVGVLGQQVGATDLAQRFATRITELSHSDQRYGDSDPHLWSDLTKALTKAAVDKALEDERPKIEKQIRERLQAEARANGRAASPPPAKVPSSAGGAKQDDRELLADPNTPIEKLMEIRARQRAAQ